MQTIPNQASAVKRGTPFGNSSVHRPIRPTVTQRARVPTFHVEPTTGTVSPTSFPRDSRTDLGAGCLLSPRESQRQATQEENGAGPRNPAFERDSDRGSDPGLEAGNLTIDPGNQGPNYGPDSAIWLHETNAGTASLNRPTYARGQCRKPAFPGVGLTSAVGATATCPHLSPPNAEIVPGRGGARELRGKGGALACKIGRPRHATGCGGVPSFRPGVWRPFCLGSPIPSWRRKEPVHPSPGPGFLGRRIPAEAPSPRAPPFPSAGPRRGFSPTPGRGRFPHPGRDFRPGRDGESTVDRPSGLSAARGRSSMARGRPEGDRDPALDPEALRRSDEVPRSRARRNSIPADSGRRPRPRALLRRKRILKNLGRGVLVDEFPSRFPLQSSLPGGSPAPGGTGLPAPHLPPARGPRPFASGPASYVDGRCLMTLAPFPQRWRRTVNDGFFSLTLPSSGADAVGTSLLPLVHDAAPRPAAAMGEPQRGGPVPSPSHHP